MTLFLGLLLAHFVCDFPLQSDWIGKNKSPRAERTKLGTIWPWVMTAHAATHAAGTYVVTRSIEAAVFQFALHWTIDVMKCLGLYGFHVDQTLHLLTAALIAIIESSKP